MVTLLDPHDLNVENCSIALVYPKYVPLNIIKTFQLLIALISLPFILWNVRRFYKKRGTIHVNLLIVYTNAFIFYGVHSLTIFIFQSIRMIKYLTYQSPCDLFTVKWTCDLYKSFCFICLIGFTVSHACMSIERALATFMAKDYEQKGKIYGLALTLLMWISAIVVNFTVESTVTPLFTLSDNFYDYCISMGNANGTLNVHWIMLGIDFMMTMFDVLLLKINQINGNTIYRKVISYDLSKRFQISENFSTIKTIIPIVVTHSVLYTLYLICAVIIRITTVDLEEARRTLFEAVYTIISVYILAMMLVLLKAPIGKKNTENKIIQKNNEGAEYFKAFQSQWNGPEGSPAKGKIVIKKVQTVKTVAKWS